MDVFSDGDGQLALPVAPFRNILRPTGCRLDPMEGFPVVWRYTVGPQDRQGVVLNVAGLLNGGPISISSRGWLYEAERDGRFLALFMPGSPKRLRLGGMRYKVLSPETARTPLYPEGWPKQAVQRVVRVRFRTIVVLNAEYLLAQVPQLAPPAAAPEPAAPGAGPPDPAAA
jgi:hypothetical protein